MIHFHLQDPDGLINIWVGTSYHLMLSLKASPDEGNSYKYFVVSDIFGPLMCSTKLFLIPHLLPFSCPFDYHSKKWICGQIHTWTETGAAVTAAASQQETTNKYICSSEI